MGSYLHIESEYRQLLAGLKLDTLDAWLRLRDRRSAEHLAELNPRFLSPHPDRLALSLDLPDDREPGRKIRVYAKIHFAISPVKTAKQVLTTGRLCAARVHELRWLRRLAELGIDAMSPVAVGQRRVLGLPLAAVLIVLEVPPKLSLFDLVLPGAPAATATPAAPMGLWRAVGRTVGMLRRHGIWWDDLKAKHLFPQPPDGGDDWRIFLIDVERMTPRRIGRAEAELKMWSVLLRSLPARPPTGAVEAMARGAQENCAAAVVSGEQLAATAESIFSRRPVEPSGYWWRCRQPMVRQGDLLVSVDWQAALASAGLTDMDAIFGFQSSETLTKPGLPATRRRDRLTLPDGRTLYLKRYQQTPRQRVSRLVSRSRYGSTARDEWHALYRLACGDIPVPEPVLLGESGPERCRWRSCIALAELPDAESLERWLPREGARLAPDRRRELFMRLADFIAHFHSLGLAHRDLYLSHIFIRWSSADGCPAAPVFWLIDLARVFRPARWRFRRWVVKDLAALHYSLGQMIEPTEWDAFMSRYAGDDRTDLARLSRAVEGKSRSISRHAERRRRRGR